MSWTIKKVIKGEKAAVDLLRRMGELQPDERLHWCESFAKTLRCTVERIYEKSPSDAYYSEYIIIYKDIEYFEVEKHPDARCSISDLRHNAYEEIRAGKIH